MSAASTPPFDNGGYRWAVNTSDDRSGTLYIFTFLGFTYSSFTFLTRLYIKWHMLGLDDAAMLAAQVADVVQFSLMLACLSAGLAKSFDILTEAQYSQMASIYVSNQIAIYITLGISKLATILLVQRLFTKEMKDAWKTCTAIISAIVIWTIASALLVSVGCPPDSLSPRIASQACPGLETRYTIVIITDALTDAVLAFIPTYLIRHLQMPMGFKLQVLGIFALRLPLVVLTVLFFKAWHISLHSENPGVFRTAALVLQQAQVCASLLASTIPCLKSFLRSFDTGSGVKPGLGSSSKSSGRYGHMSTIRHSKSQTRQRDEAYQMDTFRTTASSGSISPPGERGRRGESRTSRRVSAVEEDAVTSNKSVDLDRRSSQRSTDQLFIRKDVQWTVKNEPAHSSAKDYRPGKLQLPK